MKDQVDAILAQWKRERPDLDTSPMAALGRISRASQYIEKALRKNFRQYGLSNADFDVLATLRRSGEPFELTPTDLFSALMLTSGTMTNRLDRLEEAGFVSRRPNPQDRRGILVGLTQAGKRLIDSAVETHLTQEEALLSHLSADEISDLSRLLRKLLLALGDRAGS
ncbi:MAG: MarR family transcriptional regulator [Chloroflexota bacterium]